MIDFQEIKQKFSSYDEKILDIKNTLNISKEKIQLDKLEEELLDSDIWKDQEKFQNIMKSVKNKKNKIESFEKINLEYEDLMILLELAIEENDNSLLGDIKKSANNFENNFEELRLSTLLNGEYDSNNAIITLHAGAGGTEACDWTSMLLRMYLKFADKMKFKVEELDYQDGDEAGVKSVTLQINGENAYGYLKSEGGVHRLIRMSPFDSSGKRHTSFSSCEVIPEIDDEIEVEINPEDLRIDTYRASGAGGQHVNMTDSAVRITHIPTNTVAQCQNERSQLQNRDRAMKMLKAKLFEKKRIEQMQKREDMRGEVKAIGWGNQIRSYIFHPYNMVKDHRTNEEVGNVQSVMDGNILNFVNAYLNWILE